MKIEANAAARAVVVDGKILDPAPSQRVRNHSPDGFNWGYAGSGPAQLALAIVLASGVPASVALRHYQAFKFQFIAGQAMDRDWTLELNVRKWVDDREREKDAAAATS